jgi:hypothetical protein
MSAVWTPANLPAEARIPCIQANSNRSPRLVREPRRPANTGEEPRKRWVLRETVRLCAWLFVGFGPQWDRSSRQNGPQKDRCVELPRGPPGGNV